MIWGLLIILLLSIGLNTFLYRKLHNPKSEPEDNTRLNEVLNQMGESGSALPDLSVNLTELAASNLKSVDSFRASTGEVQSILQDSVSRFHQIDEIGKLNVTGIAQRIEELQGFIQSIEELNKHNNSVSETVSLLEDISSQTSMLALNASVESARAGEHGKGFAVIAKSVQDLSSKSLATSESIREVVNLSKAKGVEIAGSANRSSEALGEISESINHIIHSLEEGMESFERNSTIVDAIVTSADELDATVHKNLHVVRESSHIGIKLGIHLNDLWEKSNLSRNGVGADFEFIKPAHVFHYNFTNTLPALNTLFGITRGSLNFPVHQDKKIKPADVYKKLLEISRIDKRIDMLSSFDLVEDIDNVQPIEVLRLSVAFCESVQKRSGRAMLDKELAIQYNDWKTNREIAPSDVYALVDHFRKILTSR